MIESLLAGLALGAAVAGWMAYLTTWRRARELEGTLRNRDERLTEIFDNLLTGPRTPAEMSQVQTPEARAYVMSKEAEENFRDHYKREGLNDQQIDLMVQEAASQLGGTGIP